MSRGTQVDVEIPDKMGYGAGCQGWHRVTDYLEDNQWDRHGRKRTCNYATRNGITEVSAALGGAGGCRVQNDKPQGVLGNIGLD